MSAGYVDRRHLAERIRAFVDYLAEQIGPRRAEWNAAFQNWDDMKISFDDLSLFLSVARAGAFAEAARRQGVPASTLSRRVAALEEALQTPLLRRSSRRVSLTDEGLRLLEACSGPFDEIRQAFEGLSG